MIETHFVCNDGLTYLSLSTFAKVHGFPRTTVRDAIKRQGVFQRNGITLHKNLVEVISPTFKKKEFNLVKDLSPSKDKLAAKLVERYSEKELKALANGTSLDGRKISYPEINLRGNHHKIMVMSDTHIGSIYTDSKLIIEAFKEAEAQGCEAIFHVGDLVEGLTPRRIGTQIYELTHIGYKAQRDEAVKIFNQCNLPVYCISGNHDMYFNEFAGANIVEDICNIVPNMTYLGHDEADIMVDGAIIRLFHGCDSGSYAYSYRLQKIVESLPSGKKPNILLAGHVHKFCYIFDRMVHAVSIPSIQMQSSFMRAKRAQAHVGFTIISFDTDKAGVNNFKIKFYPYYA